MEFSLGLRSASSLLECRGQPGADGEAPPAADVLGDVTKAQGRVAERPDLTVFPFRQKKITSRVQTEWWHRANQLSKQNVVHMSRNGATTTRHKRKSGRTNEKAAQPLILAGSDNDSSVLQEAISCDIPFQRVLTEQVSLHERHDQFTI